MEGNWKLSLVNFDTPIRHPGGDGWESVGYRNWNSWEGTLQEMLGGVLQAEIEGF